MKPHPHPGFNRSIRSTAFVLRLKPHGEGVIQILFPKLKLGANYFIRLSDVVPPQAEIFRAVVFSIEHCTLNHCTLNSPVVGSLLFVSPRTNMETINLTPHPGFNRSIRSTVKTARRVSLY